MFQQGRTFDDASIGDMSDVVEWSDDDVDDDNDDADETTNDVAGGGFGRKNKSRSEETDNVELSESSGLAGLVGSPLLVGRTGVLNDNGYSNIFLEGNKKSKTMSAHEVGESEQSTNGGFDSEGIDLLLDESSQKVDIDGNDRVLFIQVRHRI